jgi:gamma-glutamyltranspeptidase / glutathione hydrolase
MRRIGTTLVTALAVAVVSHPSAPAQMRTQKPPLHAKQWMAITGKPLAATAGAMMFQKGGNAVDAAAAMLAATSTMWDTLGWGGETQALIYNPKRGKVIGINALGVAPTGATPDFFRSQGMNYPPEYGPLAAVTPGTPGGLMTMLAEYGTLSLADVLGPSIDMADGYPIERQAADTIERQKRWLKQWPYSAKVFLPNMTGDAAGTADASPTAGGAAPAQDRIAGALQTARREGPEPGSLFRQPDLARTLRMLVETEQEALRSGRSRKEAIYAANDRFYRGDIAAEIVRSTREQGGLFTAEDLANWRVRIEEPVSTNYKGIEVYKLNVWTQGPAMLQALNILEGFDLKSMGYNSTRYIHTLYHAMSLAFADRDFYYGDIYSGPEEPVRGLLSKEYARERAKLIGSERNDPSIGPGDPYRFQGGKNPYPDLLKKWGAPPVPAGGSPSVAAKSSDDPFFRGTTTIEAADAEGWVVSITPSGGWIPAVIAGTSGIGLSQRMQSFVLDPAENPFNVLAPGRQPRVTLTPTLALRDGRPYLAFAVQGGDTQDQNLLQFFLNVVEFGMSVQEASEAPNFNSFQMRSSFGAHTTEPGKITLNSATPPYVRAELRRMGYRETPPEERTSGPINAILFDRKHGTMWGGSSNHGEDYGIGW